MLKANLLPADEQQAVNQEQTRRLIWFFSVIVSCCVAIAIVLLFPSYLTVLYREQEVADSLDIEKNAFEKLGIKGALLEIKNLKQSMGMIQNALKDESSSSQLLSALLDSGGERVVIQTISVDANGSVSLTGRSQTRDDLLAFEEVLKNSGRLQKITLPLEDIVKDTNISFTVQAEIKK